AGVQYGMFDLDRLINVLSLSKDRRLAVKHEGIEAVEQYVLAKHFISRQVYQHKIRRVTDLMIVQGIISGMEADENLNKLYRYDEDDSYLSFYLEYDDESIQYIMRNIDDMSNIGWQYFDMLRRRILLKELYQEKFKLVARESQESARKFEEITRGGPAELLDEISQVAGLSREFTYVDTFSLKVPPQAKRDRFYDDEESILVTRPDGSTGMLKDDSTIFHSMISDAAEPVISVYGIPRNEKAEIDRDMIRKKVDDILVGYFRRT
ncbi:MAG: hypothetical protein KAW61_04080, partial [candidate division Zixibacteria bacterium]|nr:hypothetical protein [candidate division Zixibacteria bacterium]